MLRNHDVLMGSGKRDTGLKGEEPHQNIMIARLFAFPCLPTCLSKLFSLPDANQSRKFTIGIFLFLSIQKKIHVPLCVSTVEGYGAFSMGQVWCCLTIDSGVLQGPSLTNY
jgi:hypothetical protein